MPTPYPPSGFGSLCRRRIFEKSPIPLFRGNTSITSTGADTMELVGVYTNIAVGAFTNGDFIA